MLNTATFKSYYKQLIITGVLTGFLCWIPSLTLAAATLGLSPATGEIGLNSTKTVALAINTGDQAINSVQATITFPEDKLEVTAITKGSILTIWAEEPSYSNSSGAITFSGGVPSPGYQGHGTILTITFKAKVSGLSTLNIVGGTILANDGEGTNVYGGANGASYTVVTQASKSTNSSTTLSDGDQTNDETENIPAVAAAPTITSTSHPDANSWYSTSDIILSWSATSDVTNYSWVLDQQVDTVPDDTNEGSDTTTTFSSVVDGIWYFHIKSGNANGWGDTAHFKVQIDQTAPDPLLTSFPKDYVTTSTEQLLSFFTDDALSGIDYYTVLIDGQTVATHILPENLSAIDLSMLSYGNHIITVQATDKAGNRVETVISLTIAQHWPGVGFTYRNMFIPYERLITGLLVFMIIALCGFYVFYRTHRKHDVCIGDCHTRDCPHFNRDSDHCEVTGRLKRHRKLKKSHDKKIATH